MVWPRHPCRMGPRTWATAKNPSATEGGRGLRFPFRVIVDGFSGARPPHSREIKRRRATLKVLIRPECGGKDARAAATSGDSRNNCQGFCSDNASTLYIGNRESHLHDEILRELQLGRYPGSLPLRSNLRCPFGCAAGLEKWLSPNSEHRNIRSGRSSTPSTDVGEVPCADHFLYY